MTERPILMSGAMVRACLREVDPKTQTRRVVKPEPEVFAYQEPIRPEPRDGGRWIFMAHSDKSTAFATSDRRCPYGAPGDRLWVRETWAMQAEYCLAYHADGQCGAMMQDGAGGWSFLHHGWVAGIAKQSDGRFYDLNRYGGRWRPSIHMPRWACRLVLEVTAVRVERLQDISRNDAMAEGIDSDDYGPPPEPDFEFDYVQAYRELWDSLNAKRGFGWAANPWVWCITFRRI